MAKRRTHSSRWASLVEVSPYSSSGTRSRVRQYPAKTTSFFFSKSIFWKSSIWARKAMTSRPTLLTARITSNQPSERTGPHASRSSTSRTSFLR
jgi:hypothetical protein